MQTNLHQIATLLLALQRRHPMHRKFRPIDNKNTPWVRFQYIPRPLPGNNVAFNPGGLRSGENGKEKKEECEMSKGIHGLDGMLLTEWLMVLSANL
jgi:hypothetical protein